MTIVNYEIGKRERVIAARKAAALEAVVPGTEKLLLHGFVLLLLLLFFVRALLLTIDLAVDLPAKHIEDLLAGIVLRVRAGSGEERQKKQKKQQNQAHGSDPPNQSMQQVYVEGLLGTKRNGLGISRSGNSEVKKTQESLKIAKWNW